MAGFSETLVPAARRPGSLGHEDPCKYQEDGFISRIALSFVHTLGFVERETNGRRACRGRLPQARSRKAVGGGGAACVR